MCLIEHVLTLDTKTHTDKPKGTKVDSMLLKYCTQNIYVSQINVKICFISFMFSFMLNG